MGRPAPIVSTVFVTVLVAVYFALLAFGASPFFPDFGELLRFGAVRADRLAEGEWWRLVTAVIVHAGGLHLIVNAWPLYRLGAVLEPQPPPSTKACSRGSMAGPARRSGCGRPRRA
jgi:membrane associated rhomboid family serine protease